MQGIEREKIGPLPVWGWALLSGLLVWLLYLLTLAPTTGFWDTSEYIATAQILGLPHPPGNPLFVLLGRTWSVLLSWTGLSVAVRINLLSATMSAAASTFWFLAVTRIWAHFTSNRKLVLAAAFAAVLVGATAFTVWSQSNINEKVYTVSLFFVALVTYLTMLWEDESGTPRGDRLLVLIAFLLGLGAANHTMSALPLPALVVFVLWHEARTVLRWRLMAAAVAFAAVGFSVQLLFVPIRSAQNPVIDEANPECEHLIDAVIPGTYVNPEGHKRWGVRCQPLAESLNREQYGKRSLLDRQSPLSAQYANYWQYFDWQWARGLGEVSVSLRGRRLSARNLFTMLFFFFGLVGLGRHWRGDRDSFVYFFTLMLTVTVALVFYLNFRYGYSIYPQIQPVDLHEVRERDYFYVISFNLWGLYTGLGIVALWEQLAEAWRGAASPLARYLRTSPMLAVAFVPLAANYSWADRSGDFSARDWAYNMLQSVEPYGVLFTNGDNDTFPLWYLQEVEGIRKDVIVIVHSYLGTSWYPSQLRALSRPCPPGVDPTRSTVIVCQRPFDRAAAVKPYRDMNPKPPTRSIISLTDDEIRRLPVARMVPKDTTLKVTDWIRVSLREKEVLTYPDLLVLHIIRQSLGDRPIYFATTAPPVYGKWGLQPHLLRQGLAHKLVDGPLEATTDTVYLGNQLDVPWLDRARARSLLWDVYQVDYLLDWKRWPEPSTRASIPTQYYLAYAALGLADDQLEESEEAEKNFQRAAGLGRLAGGVLP